MASTALGNVMLRNQFTKMFISRLAFLDEIMYENLNAPMLTYPEVFNVRDSNRAYEEILGVTGFGQFSEKAEGEKVDYDKILQGYSKRFSHKTYGKGYQISMEAQEDDIDGVITDAAPALARVARNSIETEAFSDYNGAFTTTTTPDGQYLASNSHVLVGGGTFDNLIESDISQGAIESAMNIFADMRDDRNQLVDMEPTILLIPSELRWRVHELLKSQFKPGTANNDVNAVNENQIGLRVVISKYLTDADNWFILTEPNRHRVMLYWKREPVTDHALDFDTGNMKSKMTYRFSHGAADWRGVLGGQGQ